MPASEASGPASPWGRLPSWDVQVRQGGCQAGRVRDQRRRPFQRRPVARALSEGRRSLRVGTGVPGNPETRVHGSLLPGGGWSRGVSLGDSGRRSWAVTAGTVSSTESSHRAPGSSARGAVRSRHPLRWQSSPTCCWGPRGRRLPGTRGPWAPCTRGRLTGFSAASDSHALLRPRELRRPRFPFAGFEHQGRV